MTTATHLGLYNIQQAYNLQACDQKFIFKVQIPKSARGSRRHLIRPPLKALIEFEAQQRK